MVKRPIVRAGRRTAWRCRVRRAYRDGRWLVGDGIHSGHDHDDGHGL